MNKCLIGEDKDSMEDKTFELLSQMYSEFTGKFNNLESRFDNLEGKFDKLENRQTKVELVIENDIKPTLQALLEGYHMVYEKQQEHDSRFDSIESKLERHDMEIKLVKAAM